MAEDANDSAVSENTSKTTDKTAAAINYPGLIAGILMIIIPFAGKWWTLQFGEDALYMSVSPFSLSVFSFGKEIVSPLFSSLTLALTVITILFGIFMIGGSVPALYGGKRAISDGLINSGSLKMLFVLVLFIITVIFAGFSFQQYFTGFGFSGSFPLISGQSQMIMNAGDFSIEIPVTSSLLPAFFIGIITAVLGIISRFYQKKH
ncbi:MAG: hypothetical protein PHO78_08735 [Methanomicrobium sp.]|nr:hypothetical protein [Methanomicrobium sp.]